MARTAVPGKPVPVDGYLREWLALGSFVGNPPSLMTSSEVDERRVLPSPGRPDAGRVWTRLASKSPVIDFMRDGQFLKYHVQCASYLHVYVHVAEAQTAYVALGSDDGAVVWVNAGRVFALDATRGVAMDGDLIPVVLRKGWNRLMVKVLQYAGLWQVAIRFLAADKSVLRGLRYSLDDPYRGRWPREALAGPQLVLSVASQPEAAVCSAPPGAQLSFTVTMQNPSTRTAPGGQVTVSSAGTPVLRPLPYRELKPLSQASLRCSIPAAVWAKAWRHPLRFEAEAHGKSQCPPMELRPSVVEAFHILTATPLRRLPARGQASLNRLREDTAAGIEVVRLVPAFEKAIGELVDSLLDGGPDRTRQALSVADALAAREARAMAGKAVHLVSHAHTDMNWLWRWPETVAICRDTFRQALRFMGEFPQFVFNQSQASCYEAMELEAPDIFAGIRTAVRRGRWHVTGGMWTEGDTNLSSGEALARSFLMAQTYFRKRLGVQARTGWLPDNFGHAAQLPQLMSQAGIDSFYHMRCAPFRGAQLYWWESPDGSRVLAKTGVVYGGQVSPNLRTAPDQAPAGTRQQIVVYGVGDHGGGPTRKDITSALRYQQSRLMPEVRLSTAHDYFWAVLPKARGLQVHRGELNYTLTGCYTSVARVKQANRDLENALQSTEAAAVASLFAGADWPSRSLQSAWKTLTFSEFHDILPGSAINESNLDTVARANVALESLRQTGNASARFLMDRIRFSPGRAIPVVVFNPLAWLRSDTVVAEVVVTEKFGAVEVRDDRGIRIAAQVIRTREFDCDYHAWIQFFASGIPGVGYRTYYVTLADRGAQVPVLHWFNPYPLMPGLPPATAAERPKRGVTLRGSTVRNRFIECRFDRESGRLVSLRRMRNGTPGPNMLGPGGANRLEMVVERLSKCSAWVLDREPAGPLPVRPTKPVVVLQEGDESVSWMAEFAWGNSTFRLTTTVHADTPRIDCALEAEWLERGTEKDGCPMLRLAAGIAGSPETLACDVPFAVAQRPAGIEVPAQRWVDVKAPGGGLGILNRGKYGHSLVGGVVRVGLLRSFVDPDRLPDVGRHTIRWALLPHAGSWFAAGLPRKGLEYNVPLEAWQGREQEGDLPATHSFVSVDGDPWFVATGVKRAEDGRGVIVRGYDASGRGARVTLTFRRSVRSARQVSTLEEPMDRGAVTVRRGLVHVRVRPWEIVTVLVRV